MKQYIEQSQYEQLSPPERERFIAWTLSKDDYAVTYRSIGHLIWFLEESTKKQGWLHIETPGERDGWRVQCKSLDFDESGQPELIDALWEAVKMVLRGENE